MAGVEKTPFMSVCPTDAVLAELLAEATPDVSDALERHVDDCIACQLSLDRLTRATAGTDRLLNLARSLTAPLHDESVLEILGRISRRPPTRRGPARHDRPTVDGYTILGELGRGATGVVYRARHTGLDREVALKMLQTGYRVTAVHRDRLRQEARTLALLRHPNIVQVYDFGEQGGCPYFSLELVHGTTLARWMSGIVQPPRVAAELVRTLAIAVDYAHRNGVLHRDLKPSNVLIELPQSAGESSPKSQPGGLHPPAESIRVSDFGLAKWIGEPITSATPHTESGAILGTPAYMAPEQADRTTQRIGPESDVYALGVILYELLTGRPPFRADTPLRTLLQVVHNDPPPITRSHKHAPAELVAVCMKCLEKNPARRYREASALADDLERFLAGEPVVARPIGPVGRFIRWLRREPGVASALLTMSVMLAVVVPTITWLWWGAVAARDQAEQAAEAEARVRKVAQSDQDAAATARRESDHLAVELLLNEGIAACDTGDVDRGLDRFLEALRKASDAGLSDLEFTCRANLALWAERRVIVAVSPPLGSSAMAVAFSPDGKRIASGQWANPGNKPGPAVVRLRNPNGLGAIGPALEHEGSVLSVAFDHEGTRLVTGTTDGSVRIWEVETGRLARPAIRELSVANAVAFSPDGRTVAAAGSPKSSTRSGEARVWDVATGDLLAKFSLSGRADAVAFTPDGKTLLTGARVPGSSEASESGEVRQWDVATGKSNGPTLVHGQPVNAVTCSPDGKRLVTGGDDRLVVVWDRVAGHRVGQPLSHPYVVRSVAFTQDGRTVITGGGNWNQPPADTEAGVRLWDVETGRLLAPPFAHWAVIHSATVHPDGRTVVAAGRDGYLRLVRFSPNRPHSERRLPGPAAGLTYTQDGRRLLVAGGDRGRSSGYCRWEDVATGRLVRPHLEFPHAVTALALSVDGRRFALGFQNGDVRVFDSDTDALIGSGFRCSDGIGSLAFSTNGESLLTASTERSWSLWDWRTGRLQKSGTGEVAVLSPTGGTLVCGTDDGHVRLSAGSGETTFESEPRSHKVLSVAFSQDGHSVLAGDLGRVVRWWDVSSGRLLGPSVEHEGGLVWGGGFLASTTLAYTVAGNGYKSNCAVHLRDTSTGRLIRRLPHVVNPQAVTVGHGGRLLLTGGRRNGVGVWDPRTGYQLGPELGHSTSVRWVALSPDGRSAAAASEDGELSLWALPAPVKGSVETVTRWLSELRKGSD